MHFGENDVLALEVSQKSVSALLPCMGITFFFIRALRGNPIFTVVDTSPARRRCFSFFQHLPSENKKKYEIAPGSLILDDPPRKMRKANEYQNVTFFPRLRTGRVFEIDKIASNRSKIVQIMTRGTLCAGTLSLSIAGEKLPDDPVSSGGSSSPVSGARAPPEKSPPGGPSSSSSSSWAPRLCWIVSIAASTTTLPRLASRSYRLQHDQPLGTHEAS